MNTSSQRFNIALIPNEKIYYQELSETYYDISDYKVGKTSIPHITIAQFYEKEEAKIKKIKNLIFSSENIIKTLKIQLNESIFKIEEQYAWLELRLSDSQSCIKLHDQIKKILHDYDIKCINLPFVPHLTIAKIISDDKIHDNFVNLKINREDDFHLYLGHADSIGQLTSTL